jgi:ComF family protein
MDEELAENSAKFQLQSVTGWGKSLWTKFKDALTPPRCLGCQAPVATSASVCITCWQKLKLLDDPVCNIMGTPFAYDQGEGIISAEALTQPPPWDKARAAVIFDDASKEYVHQLKYTDRLEAGLFMARLMARAGHKLLQEADLVIPVPLHRFRLWKRRFNQAAFLAQNLNAKIYDPRILKRIRATPQQVGLDANARRKNMRNAFQVVDATKVEGKSILLVDDVRTTGATTSACVDALKKAGATKVNLLTFALVNQPFKPHIDR